MLSHVNPSKPRILSNNSFEQPSQFVVVCWFVRFFYTYIYLCTKLFWIYISFVFSDYKKKQRVSNKISNVNLKFVYMKCSSFCVKMFDWGWLSYASVLRDAILVIESNKQCFHWWDLLVLFKVNWFSNDFALM